MGLDIPNNPLKVSMVTAHSVRKWPKTFKNSSWLLLALVGSFSSSWLPFSSSWLPFSSRWLFYSSWLLQLQLAPLSRSLQISSSLKLQKKNYAFGLCLIQVHRPSVKDIKLYKLCREQRLLTKICNWAIDLLPIDIHNFCLNNIKLGQCY